MLLLLLPLALAGPATLPPPNLPPPALLPGLPRLQRHPPRLPAPPYTSAVQDEWDVQTYDIQVDIDPDARTVEGGITITATAQGSPPEHIVLHADGPQIHAISVQGEEVEWAVVGDEVLVPIPAGLTEVGIGVRYTVSEEEGSDSYLGLSWGNPLVSFHEPEGARHWLVVRDVPHDKAALTWRTTLPEGWDVVQNGELTGVQTDEGRTTWTFQLDEPVPPYLMVLHAGTFASWTDPASAVPVQVHADPDLLDAAVADLADTAAILDLFAGLWGDYPWPLYRNVVVPFGGGMEHTTATTFGEELIGTSSAGLINAHEAAHHWWGDYLTCATWDEIWLNEGFASHAELRWYEASYGEEGRAAYFDWQRQTYLEWKGYEGVFSLYDPNFMWGGTVYEKGSLVLEMLRGQVGADTFDAALRRYADAHAHGAVTTPDLRAAFEAETGQDWGWYFDQWVYQADDPVYEVGLHQRALDDGGWQVDLHARQVNEAGSWQAPLSWRLTLEGAGEAEQTLWVGDEDAVLSLCLEAPVLGVALDPDTRLLHGGISRDDGAFDEVALTCGDSAEDPDPPGARVYPLGCGGCATTGAGRGGWLQLPALLLTALLGLAAGARRRA